MARADPLRCDVVVVGSGPAGGAAAIALARAGRSVALIERSHHQGFRAGETLPPEVREALDQLGVWDRFQQSGAIASEASKSAWGEAAVRERHAITHPLGPGWHVDRGRFDALIAEEAGRQGATLLRGAAVRSIARASGGWIAEIAGDGGSRRITARIAVDATGRRSTVGTKAGARRATFDRLIGVAGILGPYDATADPTLLVEAMPDGYWYSVPLPGDRLLACWMRDAEIRGREANATKIDARRGRDRWRDALDRAPHTAARAAGLTLEGGIHVRAAESAILEPAAGPDWIAIGDAARSHDPLSALGVRTALTDGIEAAAIVARALSGDGDPLRQWTTKVREGFFRYLWQRRAYYRLETRWPDAPFWARRRELPGAPIR